MRMTNVETMAKPRPCKSYRDLIVWQNARCVWRSSLSRSPNAFPMNEVYGPLIRQMRRAAVYERRSNYCEADKRGNPRRSFCYRIRSCTRDRSRNSNTGCDARRAPC